MARRILAIETATDWLSVALLEDEQVIEAIQSDARMQHASALLPAIDTVLGAAGRTLDELDGLAVSTGPGSFTSLRIGLATIKGLAFRRDLPAIGVSTLEAMALAGLEEDDRQVGKGAPASTAEGPVLALLDARRGQWYAGSWRGPAAAGGLPEPVLPEGLYDPEAIAARLDGSVQLRAPQPGNWQSVFERVGLATTGIAGDEAARPSALWVGRLASRRFAVGEGGQASALAARYVRRAEAEAMRLGGPVEAGEVAQVEEPGGPT